MKKYASDKKDIFPLARLSLYDIDHVIGLDQ
jgi:hypothetical protein